MQNRSPLHTPSKKSLWLKPLNHLTRRRDPLGSPNVSLRQSKGEDYYTDLLQEKFLVIFIDAGPYSRHCFLEHICTFSSNIDERGMVSTKKTKTLSSKLRSHAKLSSIDKATTKCLIRLIEQREIDEGLVISTLKKFVANSSGFSIKCMGLVLAIHICSVFSDYPHVNMFLDQLRNAILNSDCEELLGPQLKINIIMLMRVRNYTRAQQYVHKLIKISWLFLFEQLQLWGYLQLAIIYLDRHDTEKSQVMQDKYEKGFFQPLESKYRQYCVEKVQEQIRRMKDKNTDFELANEDLNYKLIKKPDVVVQNQESFNKDLKLFRRMLIRMPGELKVNNIEKVLRKVSRERLKNEDQVLLKSNLRLSHTSKLKNLNNYFRQSTSHHQLITIDEPNKNWPLFKEMVRRISIEYAYGNCVKQCIPKARQEE